MATGRIELERKIDAICAEFSDEGLSWTYGHGGTHPHVRFDFKGQSRLVTYSSRIPDSGRAIQNTLSQIRRTLREIGLGPEPEKPIEINCAATARPALINHGWKGQTMQTVTPITQARPAPEEDSKKFARLSADELIKATMLWVQHGRAVDGVWIYADGWDDERVRREVNTDVSVDRYIENRRKHFGPTPAEKRAEDARVVYTPEQLSKLVRDMEDRIRVLEDAITAPRAAAV